MSLLLEALKKAEQAKQGVGAPDPESTLHGGEGLSLAPTGTPAPTAPATPAGERTPVTRDRLPDIDHSTLEILSDDLPSATTTREPAATGAPATEQPAAASRRPGARAAAARTPAEAGEDLDREQAGRDAARRLFEAKPADYDPRRPFKITLVTLGVAAIAIIVYFWWQTQPRSLQVAQPPAPPTQIAAAPAPANAAPPPAPAATPPAAADPGTATAAAAPPAATAAASGPAPRTAPAPPQPMASRPAPSASSPAVRDRPAAPRRERPQAPAAVRAAPGTDISVSRSISGINAALAEGYAAFQSGDLAAAGRAYQRALAADPRNKDALLGLAAVNLRTGSFKSAEGYYLRVLEIDPRDPDANAGMVSLRGRSDPVQSESRLKTLIAANPDAAALHFALGNQLAVQSRWAEAQAAYFRAVTIEPENPDYAFNLAVSLDQLRQARPALEYYQRALALAGARAASFNKAQVETRIRELQR